MADELIENVEYSKKKKDEEEPILVAQRYLNIFHQIHIFNQARILVARFCKSTLRSLRLKEA